MSGIAVFLQRNSVCAGSRNAAARIRRKRRRGNPLDFGLRWGEPRVWGKYVLIACIVAALLLFVASFIPSLQVYYVKTDFSFGGYFLASLASLSAQEFLYRGFLLFGLRDKLKEGSILVQTIPFVLMHLGKPEVETLSTIFGGAMFGFIAWQSQSFIYPWLIHWFIATFTMFIATGRI